MQRLGQTAKQALQPQQASCDTLLVADIFSVFEYFENHSPEQIPLVAVHGSEPKDRYVDKAEKHYRNQQTGIAVDDALSYYEVCRHAYGKRCERHLRYFFPKACNIQADAFFIVHIHHHALSQKQSRRRRYGTARSPVALRQRQRAE